jgi:hypothetical protein
MGVTQKLGTLPLAILTDASNNVGIGAAPSGSYKLEVTGTGRFTGGITAQTGEFISGGQDGSIGSVVRISTTSTNAAARNWGIVNTWDNFGDLTFRVSNAQGGNALSAGSTKMVILSSGNVGIGTSSPANYFTTTLTIDGSSSQGIMFRASGTDKGFLFQDGSFIQLGSNAGGVIFKSADTERMRIQSNGIIKMTSTSSSYGQLQLTSSDSESGIGFRLTGNVDEASWVIGKGTGGSGASFALYYAGVKGSLTTAGVWSTTGGGTSDLRTKQDIDYDFDNGIESIIKLQPTKFKFKNAPDKQRRGFIAQDVLSVIPDLVLGDGELEDGTYGLDYDGILALAVKAIQELNERLNKAGL